VSYLFEQRTAVRLEQPDLQEESLIESLLELEALRDGLRRLG
jgi:hypothetical protein